MPLLYILATGGWPQRDNVHSHRLQDLVDTYKQIMLAPKHKKELDKKKKFGKFVSLTVSFRLSYRYTLNQTVKRAPRNGRRLFSFFINELSR